MINWSKLTRNSSIIWWVYCMINYNWSSIVDVWYKNTGIGTGCIQDKTSLLSKFFWPKTQGSSGVSLSPKRETETHKKSTRWSSIRITIYNKLNIYIVQGVLKSWQFFAEFTHRQNLSSSCSFFLVKIKNENTIAD